MRGLEWDCEGFGMGLWACGVASGLPCVAALAVQDGSLGHLKMTTQSIIVTPDV